MYNKIILADGEQIEDIKGYEGLYAVTTHGRVWSYPKRQGKDMYLADGKWLTLSGRRAGYVGVTLSKNRKPKTFSVHRLVAVAFIKNLDEKRTVNHKDGTKTNNLLENLEWATYSENHKHAFKNGFMKISDKCKEAGRQNLKKAVEKIRKISIDDTSEICEAYATGLFSCRELAIPFGVSDKTINNLVKGRSYVV